MNRPNRRGTNSFYMKNPSSYLGNRSSYWILGFYITELSYIFYIIIRRPVAQKVRDIGVWFDIMETLGKHLFHFKILFMVFSLSGAN
jgi:hypothetical protein